MQITKAFNYQNSQVRTVVKDNDYWFVAKDVCEILDISNYRDAVSRLNPSMKDVATTDTPGGKQEISIISEAGVYKLVFTSRKPEAEKFTDWLAKEVIPSIRKHGAYMTPETIEKAILNPDFIIDLASRLKDEQQKRIEAEQIIEAQKPKVLFAEALLTSNTNILINDLAKLLKQNGIDTGEKRLYKWLRENGYLINRKGTDHNSPTQKSMEMGLFVIKEYPIFHNDGTTTINKTSKVTPKGQKYFLNKFINKSA